MITLFFNGLLWGVWLLGALIPTVLVLTAVGVTVYRRYFREEYVDAFTLMEDFPPDLPTSEPEPEHSGHRFIASTIVRPPKIYRKGENDDDKGKGS